MRQIGSLLKRKKEGKFLNIFLNTVIVILCLTAILRLSFSFFYTGIYVCHSSMYPTLNGAVNEHTIGGDYVYISNFDKPDYGDIVVFNDGKTTLIKRVIALSGDSIYIENGDVFLKKSGQSEFNKLKEDYVNPTYYSQPESNRDKEMYFFYNEELSYTIPPNSMFCMGDNRGVSLDSRQHGGAYSIDCLIGVVSEWSLRNKDFITKWYNKTHF